MSQNFGQTYQTARDRVLGRLMDLQWHTRQELQAAGGTRYSARILELKRQGYDIEDAPSPTGHGKDYRLVSPQPTNAQAKNVKVYLTEDEAIALTQGTILPSAQTKIQDALGSFQHNRNKL